MRRIPWNTLKWWYFTLPFCFLQAPLHAKARLPTTIIVAGTSDMHGALEPQLLTSSSHPDATSLWGGTTSYSAYLQVLRQVYPDAIVALDAGDLFQGPMAVNFSQGEVMIRAANVLRLDAVTLGNHEFDYGIAVLKERIAEAQFPFLGLNVHQKSTHRQVEWSNLQGTRLFTRHGVKIGVIGVTTTGTSHSTRPNIVRDLHFAAPYQLVQRAAQTLRAEGAELVIVLAHMGVPSPDWDSSKPVTGPLPKESEFLRLLYALPPGLVDIAIGGHTHKIFRQQVAQTLVIQSGYNSKYFGYIEAVVSPEGHMDREQSQIHAPIALCMRVFANGQCTRAEQAPGPSRPATFSDMPWKQMPICWLLSHLFSKRLPSKVPNRLV